MMADEESEWRPASTSTAANNPLSLKENAREWREEEGRSLKKSQRKERKERKIPSITKTNTHHLPRIQTAPSPRTRIRCATIKTPPPHAIAQLRARVVRVDWLERACTAHASHATTTHPEVPHGEMMRRDAVPRVRSCTIGRRRTGAAWGGVAVLVGRRRMLLLLLLLLLRVMHRRRRAHIPPSSRRVIVLRHMMVLMLMMRRQGRRRRGSVRRVPVMRGVMRVDVWRRERRRRRRRVVPACSRCRRALRVVVVVTLRVVVTRRTSEAKGRNRGERGDGHADAAVSSQAASVATVVAVAVIPNAARRGIPTSNLRTVAAVAVVAMGVMIRRVRPEGGEDGRLRRRDGRAVRGERGRVRERRRGWCSCCSCGRVWSARRSSDMWRKRSRCGR